MKTFDFIKAYMKAFMTGVGYAGIVIVGMVGIASIIMLIREIIIRIFA